MNPVNRLPLEKAYNVRELGGYPTSDGETTAYQQLIRADGLHELTKNDQRYVKSYGVRTIIDLRGASELDAEPNPFERDEEMNYINIPLIQEDVGAPHMVEQMRLVDDNFLRNMYINILQNAQEEIKQVFQTIATSKGATLFHCSAGKDRTGVIAMLLLGLVKVDRADLITNYMVTEIYLQKKVIPAQFSNQFPASLLQSRADFIEPAIDYIIDNHGSVRNYLLAIGLSEETLATITQKMLATKQLELSL